MTTRPYSTTFNTSTPIRTTTSSHRFYHHHSSSSSSSSRLKPTSGFPLVVAPVTPTPLVAVDSKCCSATRAKTAPRRRGAAYCPSPLRSSNRQQQQRPGTPNLRFLTDPRHHDHHTSSADRFIPNRRTMNMDVARRALFSDTKDPTTGKRKSRDESSDDDTMTTTTVVPTSHKRVQKAYKRQMMSTLCNIPLSHLDEDAEPKSLLFIGGNNSSSSDKTHSTTCSTTKDKNGNHGRLGPPPPEPFALDFLRAMKVGATTDNENDQASSSSSALAAQLLASSRRKLPDRPFKTLDACNVRNDFYLSVMSWNQENILAVALGPQVFLYNVLTGELHTIFEESHEGHYIMSVKWCHATTAGGGRGHSHILAVTTSSNNNVMFFDCHTMQRVATSSLSTLSDRVFAMSWKDEHFLSCGTSEGMVLNFDIRQSSRTSPVSKCQGHSSQVCGLSWSPDASTLASGCNDNTLNIWDNRIVHQSTPSSGSGVTAVHSPRIHLPQAHHAAIKAMAWCPHLSNVLATGGGTADRTIKIWNTSTGCLKNSVNAGSQVSSLVWSKHSMELCSSHGYSLNHVSLWHYHSSSLTKMKDFTFHNDRILSMDMSPDGSTLATLGGDEMLCFWNMFGVSHRSSTSSSSAASRQNHPIPSFGGHEIR